MVLQNKVNCPVVKYDVAYLGGFYNKVSYPIVKCMCIYVESVYHKIESTTLYIISCCLIWVLGSQLRLQWTM